MSEAFDNLIATVATLRGPGGCPWDKKQTHASLKPYLVEETYEALQAIDDGDDRELAAELGDVLLQVALHSQIASEEGRFTVDDVCERINEKLIRRHPHVFGDVHVNGVDDVLTNWEAIKKQERQAPGEESALHGVPSSLPALMMAMEVSKKAARVGFEWPDISGVLAKMREETLELEEALREDRSEDIADEIGDLLFTVVNVARWAKADPEDALRTMVKRFRARFEAMEDRARAAGRPLSELSPGEWDQLWNLAKAPQSQGHRS